MQLFEILYKLYKSFRTRLWRGREPRLFKKSPANFHTKLSGARLWGSFTYRRLGLLHLTFIHFSIIISLHDARKGKIAITRLFLSVFLFFCVCFMNEWMNECPRGVTSLSVKVKSLQKSNCCLEMCSSVMFYFWVGSCLYLWAWFCVVSEFAKLTYQSL